MEDLKKTALKIEQELKKNGADKAHIVVTRSETHEFNISNGEFSLFRTLFNDSIGMTVLKDHKKGSAAINKTDDASIKKAALDCVKSAESGVADEAYDIAPKQENQDFCNAAYNGDIPTFFARSKELLEAITVRHPKIRLSDTVFQHIKMDKFYRNTNGTEFSTKRGWYCVEVSFSALDGDKTTSMNGTGFVTESLDEPFIERSDIEKQLCDTERQLDLRAFDGKITDGTILLTPKCLSQFLGDIMGNFVSGAVIRDKTSIWLNKLGKQVADNRLTIRMTIDDPRIVCPQKYTSDGFIAESYNLIENGILKTFQLDLFNANKTGFERVKNTDSSVVIEGGEKSLESIIKGIKKGLLVGSFSGGAPGTNGDFSGVAKNSFYIEDGEIKYPVNEVMINGNLSDILMNIQDISRDVVCNGEDVLPYISFGGIVISGK